MNEPNCLLVACACKGSPLSKIAYQYEYVNMFEFELPTKRDGFLATNSLLAFSILFTRAYNRIFNTAEGLPKELWQLIAGISSTDKFLEQIGSKLEELLDRKYIVALYGQSTMPAALDLESKFTEAALGVIQLADYRNFAHGRHHWLAKHGNNTAVLSLSSDRDTELSQKTLALLPTHIPRAEFSFSGSYNVSSIAALVTVFHIVGLAGKARGIDPGRPGVPQFGRRIYSLRPSKLLASGRRPNIMSASIARKVCASPGMLGEVDRLKHWRNAYKSFMRDIKKTSFSAIVFDYDGTLCDRKNRFGTLTEDIAEELIRLLEAGIAIGVATGRGKSARQALREVIPIQYWHRLLLGHYNGSDCGLLADDNHPDGTEVPSPELASIADILSNDDWIIRATSINVRKSQITIGLNNKVPFESLWSHVNEIVHQHSSPGTRVVTSSHSIDVLAPGVSKKHLVSMVKTRYCDTQSFHVLVIGDQGCWPGNDFELLSEPLSLSVDRVSSSKTTCWNIAPAGIRGKQATLYYLRFIEVTEDGKAVIFLRKSSPSS